MFGRRDFIAASSAAALAGCAPRLGSLNVVVPDGIWTWFNDPRAIVHHGQLIVGSINSHGVIQLTAGGRTVPMSELGQVDDHNNPALLATPLGLAIFYSRHNDEEGLRYRVGSGPEQIIPGKFLTYAKPYLIDGTVHVFSRDSGDQQMATSTDLRTWSVRPIFSNPGQQPYVVCCQDRTRIHFLMTDGHPRSLHTTLYHAYLQDGLFHRSDGTVVRSGLVRDFTHIGEGWNWQIAVKDGLPRALTISSERAYNLHRWTGRDWVTSSLAPSQPNLYPAEEHYVGGMCFNGANPDRLFLSLHDAQYELSEWHLSGRKLRQITSNSAYPNLRPYSPAGTSRVLWVAGKYKTFVDYRTSICVA
jgi:hypothetical protein